jgi:hypothetical protein
MVKILETHITNKSLCLSGTLSDFGQVWPFIMHDSRRSAMLGSIVLTLTLDKRQKWGSSKIGSLFDENSDMQIIVLFSKWNAKDELLLVAWWKYCTGWMVEIHRVHSTSDHLAWASINDFCTLCIWCFPEVMRFFIFSYKPVKRVIMSMIPNSVCSKRLITYHIFLGSISLEIRSCPVSNLVGISLIQA